MCLLIVRVSGVTLGSFREATEARRTFSAVADTFARSTEPDRNFGTRSSVRTDASPYVSGFLRFDPDGLAAPISSAILRIYAGSANSRGIDVRGLTTNSWGEATLTYRNMPAVLSVVSSSGRITAGTWIQWDVTSLVRGNDPVSFGLTSTSITATSLASRESSNGPQLIVTHGSTPLPSGPSPSPPTSPSPPPGTPSPPPGTPSPPPSQSPSPSPSLSPSPSPTPTQPSPPPSPPSGVQPSFPIRAVFYYPWFPNAWNQQGTFPYTNYTPARGHYDSGNRQTIHSHISEMQQGKIEAGIASWWGPGHHTDARVRALLEVAASTSFRWTLYYEDEGSSDPAVATIDEDLSWIQSRYSSSSAYLRVAGRPVIFVYGDPGDGCGTVDRWVEANRSHGFYLVLKVFSGYRSCPRQPDSWHQYAPAKPFDSQFPNSYSIAPGFWKAKEAPRLGRDLSRWRGNIRDMISSGARWQLVVSWNEWGEGTQVEESTELGDAWLQALAADGADPVP